MQSLTDYLVYNITVYAALEIPECCFYAISLVIEILEVAGYA